MKTVTNHTSFLRTQFWLSDQNRLLQMFQLQRKAKNHPAHSIHRWYGKFMPSTPRWAIKEFTEPNEVIFDPFCGSGTVCLEAMLAGRQVIGNDIDPLACLISRVKTTPIDPQLVEKAFHWIQKNYDSLTPLIPDFPRCDYWFTMACQTALGQILAAISQIEPPQVKDFLLVSFSSIVRKSSFADLKFIITARSKHRQPVAENLTASDIWNFFSNAVKRNISRMKEIWTIRNAPSSVIHQGDAREYLPSRGIDLIVTNPPYIGSVDYVRAMRLPRYWLKLSSNDLELRYSEIGLRMPQKSLDESLITQYSSLSTALSEMRQNYNNKSSKSNQKVSISEKTLLSFIGDMERCFNNLDKPLKSNGVVVIRIGDNHLGRSKVKLGDFICELIQKIGWVERLRIKDPVTGRSLFGSKRYSKTNPDKLDYSWILVFQKEN